MRRKTTSRSDRTANGSLDTDVVRAVLKADDWLSSAVDLDALDEHHDDETSGARVGDVIESVFPEPSVRGSPTSIAERV